MRLLSLLIAVTLHAQVISGVNHRITPAAPPAPGGQTFVSSASGVSSYGVFDTTKYTSTSLNVQVHDTLLVWGALAFSPCGSFVLSPHDSTNTYTLALAYTAGSSCVSLWYVKDAVVNAALTIGMDTTGGNGLIVSVVQLRGMSNSATVEATFSATSVGAATTLTSSSFTTTAPTIVAWFVTSTTLWTTVLGSCGGSTATAATGASVYVFGVEYNLITAQTGTTCTIDSSGTAGGLTGVGGAFR